MQDKLFLALLDTYSAHAEASRREFQALDLTEGQPKILYILRRKDGQVQKDLADTCKVKQSTLTVLLQKLEHRGFIRKERCTVSGGKCANRIFLTEEGLEKAKQLDAVVENLEERGLKNFSQSESRQLLSLLARVAKNMRESFT